MDRRQPRARLCERPEIGREGNAGQIALEVGLVALAVDGMVQQPVDVVEDVPLADRLVAVVGAEAVQRPVSDVLAAVAAVLVVGVEREALGRFSKAKQGWNHVCCIGHQCKHRPVTADLKPYHPILCFGFKVGKMEGKRYTLSFIIRSK